jgi:hypothetical protein
LARYRLRFILQEFDLPRGATLIGRSLECHLTIDDPLVSRLHARITVDDSGAYIEDLGSRNGVRLNGVGIQERVLLRNGDRVRIGTQDLVFSSAEDVALSHVKATGKLRLCIRCRLPYPREVLGCPACGAVEQNDDDAPTTAGADGHSWTVRLLVDALERALRLGRTADADGLLRRAASQIDEFVTSGTRVDGETVVALAAQATRTTLACKDPAWAIWALDILGRSHRVPPASLVERVAEVAVEHPRALQVPIGELLIRLAPATASASPEELESLARLRELAA